MGTSCRLLRSCKDALIRGGPSARYAMAPLATLPPKSSPICLPGSSLGATTSRLNVSDLAQFASPLKETNTKPPPDLRLGFTTHPLLGTNTFGNFFVFPNRCRAVRGSPSFSSEASSEVKPSSKSRKKSDDGDGGDEKGKRRNSKKKDPDAPKRALSAFMFFSQAMRATVKKENPGIAFTEVGKIMGEKWNALSAEEKAPYEKKASEDKVRYSDALREYKESGKAADAGD